MQAPRDYNDLISCIRLSVYIDSYHEFPTQSNVCDSIFGTVSDTLFKVTRTEHDATFLHPVPLPGTVVDLVFGDAKVLPNVPVQADGRVPSSEMMPIFARVKSTARTMAFAYVCAKPTLQAFLQTIETAMQSVTHCLHELELRASNSFSEILRLAQASSHPCVLQRRQTLFSTFASDRNLMVDAALHLHCDACAPTVQAIAPHRAFLTKAGFSLAEAAQGVITSFFHECCFSETCQSDAVRFLPPDMHAQVLYTFNSLVASTASCSKCPDVPVSVAAEDVLRVCATTVRAKRLRAIAPIPDAVLVQHWCDAAASMALCDATRESVLNRLFVVTPDMPLDLIVHIAQDVAALRVALRHFVFEHKRRLRDYASDITVMHCRVQPHAVEKLVEAARRVQACLVQVKRSADALLRHVSSLLVMDSVFEKIQQQQLASRVFMYKQKCRGSVTRCPLGNEVYIVFEENKWLEDCFPRGKPHGSFTTVGSRIVCVDEDCLRRRGAKSVACLVSGAVPDDMQGFLDAHPCAACGKTGSFHVTAPDRIDCSHCHTQLHCEPRVVEKHGSAECARPFAGFVTCVESGTITCLGCGAVVCDAIINDREEDERTYADDGEDNSRVSYVRNPYLSDNSNVTFLRLPPDANSDSKKLLRNQRALNVYIPRDDYCKTTTWVRRDSHMRIMCSLLASIRESKQLAISPSAAENALHEFYTMRWAHEKMCNVRLVMYALIAHAFHATRDAGAKTSATAVCTRCGNTMPRQRISAHLRSCGKKKAATIVRKRSRDCDFVTEDDVL